MELITAKCQFPPHHTALCTEQCTLNRCQHNNMVRTFRHRTLCSRVTAETDACQIPVRIFSVENKACFVSSIIHDMSLTISPSLPLSLSRSLSISPLSLSPSLPLTLYLLLPLLFTFLLI